MSGLEAGAESLRTMSTPMQSERLGQFFLAKRPGRPHWHICWFDERTRQTRRKTTGTEDEAAAMKLLAEHFLLHERLEAEPLARVPLWSILKRYQEEHGQHLVSADSVRFALKALEPHVSDLTVDDFRLPVQQRMFAALVLEGKSRSYVSRIFSVVKAAIRRSHARGEIDALPTFMPLPKSGTRERVLRLDEVASLFAAVRGVSTARYLILAFATGARPGAILEMQACQLDFTSRLILLNPPGREQNKKRRPTLPMPSFLLELAWRIEPGYVINYDGAPYSRNGWRALFGALARRAGLQGVSPYTIRHTVATELHRRGVPPGEVAAFMGHSAVSSFGTTGRYMHYQPDYLKSAAAALDHYLREIFELLRGGADPNADASLPSMLRAACVPLLLPAPEKEGPSA